MTMPNGRINNNNNKSYDSESNESSIVSSYNNYENQLHPTQPPPPPPQPPEEEHISLTSLLLNPSLTSPRTTSHNDNDNDSIHNNDEEIHRINPKHHPKRNHHHHHHDHDNPNYNRSMTTISPSSIVSSSVSSSSSSSSSSLASTTRQLSNPVVSHLNHRRRGRRQDDDDNNDEVYFGRLWRLVFQLLTRQMWQIDDGVENSNTDNNYNTKAAAGGRRRRRGDATNQSHKQQPKHSDDDDDEEEDYPPNRTPHHHQQPKQNGRKRTILQTTTTITLIVLCLNWWWRRRKQQRRMIQSGQLTLQPSIVLPSSDVLRRLLQRILSSLTITTKGVVSTAASTVIQPFRHSSNSPSSSSSSSSSSSPPPRPNLRNIHETPLSILLHHAKSGKIQRALLDSNHVVYLSPSPTTDGNPTIPPKWNKTILPPQSTYPNLPSEIIEALTQGGCTDISTLPIPFVRRVLLPVLLHSSPFLYLGMLYWLMKRFRDDGRDGGGTTGVVSSGGGEGRTTFRDVAGVGEAQRDLEEVVRYLEDPEPFVRLGARLPRGVLLYGPPGNGKTLLARAVAGEVDADYFLSCSGSDFVEVYVGQGAKRVRALFAKARAEALKQWYRRSSGDDKGRLGIASRLLPLSLQRRIVRGGIDVGDNHIRPPTAVIFIDEIDAVARSRDGIGSSTFGTSCNDEREQTLDALLTELDGFSTPHYFSSSPPSSSSRQPPPVTILLLAATNRRSVLDPALLRPGRIDRHVLVSIPDANGREAILKVHLRDNVRLLGNDVDLGRLADDECTGGFSGAELRNVVNEAALAAVRDEKEGSGGGGGGVRMVHLEIGVRKVRRMRTSEQSTRRDFGGLFVSSG